ncbi:MAG: hypothetical protein ACI9KE_005380 [Polyangiales bacterium]|jgi:hypothetical protein
MDHRFLQAVMLLGPLLGAGACANVSGPEGSTDGGACRFIGSHSTLSTESGVLGETSCGLSLQRSGVVSAELDPASFIEFRYAECSGRLTADVMGTCALDWDIDCEFDEDGDGEIDGRSSLVGRVVRNPEGRFVGEEIQRIVGGVVDCESRYVVVMIPFED